MAEGKVGQGSQNKWKIKGIVLRYPVDGSEFTKKIQGSPHRNHSEFWTADTPVTWDGINGDTAVASVATTPAEFPFPDILVTRNPDDPNDILEYNPLITFFNEVMKRLMDKPGFKNKISNLHNKQNAIDVWEYLDETYL